jgi:uncharacterized protein (UPF0548 family)
MVTLLSARAAIELRGADFTYADVGATADVMPSGFRHVERTWMLPDADFERAGARLMGWGMHERAGLRVAASSDASPDAVVLMRLGIGPFALRIPCRVIYTVAEPHRLGFAYGTLPGHPVAGEELFLVRRDRHGLVFFTVRIFSRPATRLMRLGGRPAQWAQDKFAERYPRALAQP